TGRGGAFRFSGARARVLLALSQRPAAAREALRRPMVLNAEPAQLTGACADWRSGMIPETPPIGLRVVSADDPSLAPVSAATMTATVGCAPYKLFDGPWSHEMRDHLLSVVMKAIDAAMPDVRSLVVAAHVIVPPDLEQQIGVSEGDLDGGEIAADQMFGER